MSYIAQLRSILKAAGWSQEQLAHQLFVSFPTLNAWLNERAKPRPKSLLNIEKLYVDIVGAERVDATELEEWKYERCRKV